MIKPTEFPVKAWRLLPSMKPVEVTLVGYAHYSVGGYMKDEKGKAFFEASLFPSREDAIAHAISVLDQQTIRLEKMQATLFKKRMTLAKAQGKS